MRAPTPIIEIPPPPLAKTFLWKPPNWEAAWLATPPLPLSNWEIWGGASPLSGLLDRLNAILSLLQPLGKDEKEEEVVSWPCLTIKIGIFEIFDPNLPRDGPTRFSQKIPKKIPPPGRNSGTPRRYLQKTKQKRAILVFWLCFWYFQGFLGLNSRSPEIQARGIFRDFLRKFWVGPSRGLCSRLGRSQHDYFLLELQDVLIWL